MTSNIFIHWLSGYLEDAESLNPEQVKALKAKIAEVIAAEPASQLQPIIIRDTPWWQHPWTITSTTCSTEVK